MRAQTTNVQCIRAVLPHAAPPVRERTARPAPSAPERSACKSASRTESADPSYDRNTAALECLRCARTCRGPCL